MKAAIIGLGEAGSVFASSLRDAGAEVRAFDIKQENAQENQSIEARARDLGASLAASAADLAHGASIVLSTVTASQNVIAARSVAPSVSAGTIYVDLNSTSPDAKAEAARIIEDVGGSYVDGAAMDTVPNYGAAVPVYVSGSAAKRVAAILNPLGFAFEPLEQPVGAASTIKMMRSVVVKGIEALCAEAFLGSERAGVTEEVMKSLKRTYPGLNWQEVAAYHLGRMALHGARRAAEMRASAQTLQALGVDSFVVDGIAARQQWASDLSLKSFVNGAGPLPVPDYGIAVGVAEKQDNKEMSK